MYRFIFLLQFIRELIVASKRSMIGFNYSLQLIYQSFASTVCCINLSIMRCDYLLQSIGSINSWIICCNWLINDSLRLFVSIDSLIISFNYLLHQRMNELLQYCFDYPSELMYRAIGDKWNPRWHSVMRTSGELRAIIDSCTRFLAIT